MQKNKIYSISKKNKNYFFEILFYIAVFFPYCMIIPLSTDLQPNALIISFLILIFVFPNKKISFSRQQKYLFFIVFIALVLCAVSGFAFEGIRSFSNYLSIFLISFASYIIIQKCGINEKLIKIIILIWFFVAFIQKFIMPDFLSFMLSSGRTTGGRGVYALSNEPSFYGITMFFMLFFIKNFKTQTYLYFSIVCVQVVFFSMSMLGIILLLCFIAMTFIERINNVSSFIKIFIVGVIILGIIIFAINVFLEGSRAQILIETIFTNPLKLFADKSVSARFAAISTSISDFFNNKFLPGGFDERIMSGYGSALKELGFFALPLIVIVNLSFASLFKGRYVKKTLYFIIMTFVMFMAIQLAHPIIGFILGYSQYQRKLVKADLRLHQYCNIGEMQHAPLYRKRIQKATKNII